LVLKTTQLPEIHKANWAADHDMGCKENTRRSGW